MAQPERRQPTYTVFPGRFSADPAGMAGFLETLGLSRIPGGPQGGSAVFAGASGRVAVYGADPAAAAAPAAGRTVLRFGVDDLDAAVADLRAGGLEAVAWDDAYGRQGAVRTPLGLSLGLVEIGRSGESGTVPGRQHTAASLDVVAVFYSADFARDARFYAAFGFEPFSPVDDPWWCDLRAGRGQGVIGLHATETERALAGTPVLVGLGFETSEPLDALAGRLAGAGHPARVVEDEAGPHVDVTDPDGQSLEIHLTT